MRPRDPKTSPTVRPGSRGPAALSALLLLACAGCAAAGTERHVAPLFTKLSRAGGGVEVEALGGMVLTRRATETAPVDYWAVRPFISHRHPEPGEHLTWFLPPLGKVKRTPTSYLWQLLPVVRYASQEHEDESTTWTLLALPGIYWAKTNDGRIVRAWFPFGGVVEHFLSFDRAEFVLFPLYARTERNGRTSWHYLWPIFSYSNGAGGPSWRMWPLVGNNRWEGRYNRWFFLWPFFHFQKNHLANGEGREETAWMVFPLFGRTERESFRAYTFLWPFFGYARDTESGFWAWDGPWPLVRIQEPGESGKATRRRAWPFYSYYEGDGLVSRYYLWPFYNVRQEEYPTAVKHSRYLLPFWQSWDREDTEKGSSSWRKLWPLWRYERQEDYSFFAFPALNPLWRTPVIDEHYAWIYELFTNERDGDIYRERTWLGMWRREKDADEDRRSFAGLWAQRDYSEGGRRVTETSFLFGLLRFRRRDGDGLEWKRPAFPGPGWPLERVPSSILPEAEAD